MFLQNLKSVALPVPEIIGVPKKFRQPLDTPSRPRSLFSKILWPFIRIGPVNVLVKFEVRSFTRSRDNRGYPKMWTVPGYAQAPFSPKLLTGFYSDWRCKYTPKFEVRTALPVPQMMMMMMMMNEFALTWRESEDCKDT